MTEINATDLKTLADRLGVPADLPCLEYVLDLLWEDVAGEADIQDDHSRFNEHVQMLAFAGKRWDDLQQRIDTLGWNRPQEANDLERAAIRRIKTQVLGLKDKNL